MSEWWTYTLSDFLMFSPRTYWRLIELYNAEIWPAQLAAAATGAVILALLYRGGGVASRGIALLLALAWAWVAYAFLLARYDAINWAGRYFAAGFAVQALLLALLAAIGRPALRSLREATARIGLAIYLFALVGYPLLGPLLGRSWRQAEVFGLAPDPTALGTLGLVLTWRGGTAAMALPILWCGIAGAQLWAMQAPEAALAPALALLAVVAALYGRKRG